MTVTPDDLAQLRASVDERFGAVNVELMAIAAAIPDHSADFAKIDLRFEANDRRLDSIERQVAERFDKVDYRLDRIDIRFDKMDARFDRVDGRFESLNDKTDRRFDEMRRTLDRRFGWQTVLLAGVAAASVFSDQIAAAIGA